MNQEKKQIQLLLSIIKNQNREIEALYEQIELLKSTNSLDLFEILNAITKEYDSYLNADANLKGSFEGIAEAFKTKLSNILCFFTDNPERKGNITKIILIEPCESTINSFRVTNEVTYRIKLSSLKAEIDKQDLYFAQISRNTYVNVAHFELYNSESKTIVKSKVNNLKEEYSRFTVSDNYASSFNQIKDKHKRIASHKREIDKRILIQENKS